MKKPSAFIFDAYGTIVHNPLRINPYKQAMADIRGMDPSLILKPMEFPSNFADYLARHGFTQQQVSQYLYLLEVELKSIYPCPHAMSVLKTLKEKGYKIIVASNLAYPYAEPIEKFYSQLVDLHIYSFFGGVVKPEPKFYNYLVAKANLKGFNISPSNQAIMIGDSYENDFLGPRSNPALSSFWIGNDNRQMDWYKFERFIKDNDL